MYPAAYNVLGIALKFLHDLTGAKKAFEKALELDLKMVEAQINLGTVFGLCGQWKKALRCFGRALAIEPNSAPALNNRGNVFCKEGSFDKGKMIF